MCSVCLSASAKGCARSLRPFGQGKKGVKELYHAQGYFLKSENQLKVFCGTYVFGHSQYVCFWACLLLGKGCTRLQGPYPVPPIPCYVSAERWMGVNKFDK